MEYRFIRSADKKLVADINKLLPQLTTSGLQIDERKLRDLLEDPTAELLGVFDDQSMIGMGWIIFTATLTGDWAFIEDVVVDEAYRGQGIGKELMLRLIEGAKAKGVRGVELTSRPERVAANELYKKLGFQLKQTNYFVLEFDRK